MQEVSRVGAQGLTSKSKLLAWEMPDLHTGGMRVVPGAARSRKGAGRSRRGEVTEGCVGGAEGRSKALICLRAVWMEDTGGKSGRRPGRHLQVEGAFCTPNRTFSAAPTRRRAPNRFDAAARPRFGFFLHIRLPPLWPRCGGVTSGEAETAAARLQLCGSCSSSQTPKAKRMQHSFAG